MGPNVTHRGVAASRQLTLALGLCTGLLACSSDADTEQQQGTGTASNGPGFAGAGTSGAGKSIAAGVETVSCGARGVFTSGLAPGEKAEILCFYGDPAGPPAASIEWVVETAQDSEVVHVRLTLDPNFADNSYGEQAVGWEARKKGREFKSLVGSDHAEMGLLDGDGKAVMHFKLDYISEDDGADSGYASLGVRGGDGEMMEGDEDDVVRVSTSLSRNLNECGLDAYLESSPATDEMFTPSEEAGDWDYRVVYDVWIKRSAFGDAGFGEALIDTVHASPSKAGDNTIDVTPGDCPPPWKYCNNPDGCDGNGDPREPECAGPDLCLGDGDPPPAVIRCEDTPDGCQGPI